MTISYRNYSSIIFSSCLLVACTDSPSVTATSATESTASDSEQSSSDGSTLPGTSTLITTTDPDITTTNDSEGSATSAGTVTTDETATTDETTTDMTTDISTTGPIADCDANDGEVDEACDAATPFCVSGECVNCSNAPNPDSSCLNADANTGACDLNAGTCVACNQESLAACTNQGKDFCNPWIPQCEAKCTEHSQCPNSACDLNVGTCFPENSVVYVDKNSCQNGNGTLNSPFCTIAEAYTKIETVLAKTGVIKVLSPGVYDSQVVIKSQSKIAIIAKTKGTTVYSESASALVLDEKSTVYTYQIDFSSKNATGVLCFVGNPTNFSHLWIDEGKINNHKDVGIGMLNCNLTLRRSLLYKNITGISLFGKGLVKIQNSYLTDNGQVVNPPSHTINASANGTDFDIEVEWSTILNSKNASIFCDPSSSTKIRNSIVMNQSGVLSIVCPQSISNSVLDYDSGTNYKASPDKITEWFSLSNGVYTFKPDVNLPFAELAEWQSGDSLVDYFKNLRSTVENQPPGAEYLAP